MRATGAGMGCPDWPKCFDRWIPPTSESQLPPDYQQRWSERGYAEAPFNAAKTWLEYINRLIGVAIGLLIFATFIASFAHWQSSPAITVSSFGALLMVGFEGWLGSILVETNLAGWSVSVHLAGALAVVVLLLYGLVRAHYLQRASERLLGASRLGPVFAGAILLSLLQIGLGAQVRSHIDELFATIGRDPSAWLDDLGLTFYAHRSLAILVVIVNLVLVLRIRKATLSRGALNFAAGVLLAVLLLEALAGAGLYYLGLPAVLQPLHVLLATVAVGLQMGTWLMYHYESRHAL